MGKRIGELLPIQMARGKQMEKDQVEKLLKDYRFTVLRLARINDKIRNVREITQAPISTSLQNDGVRSATTQTLNEKIANLVDLEFDYINKSAAIELELSIIEKSIDKLDPKYALLLKYFYLDGYPMESIGDKMGYNVQYLWELKAKAIEELGKLL
jgi:DNA-directed RNA polymerase specialized sigma24 family protein